MGMTASKAGQALPRRDAGKGEKLSHQHVDLERLGWNAWFEAALPQ